MVGQIAKKVFPGVTTCEYDAQKLYNFFVQMYEIRAQLLLFSSH